MAPGRPNRRSPLTLDAIDVFIAAETNKTGRPLSRYRDLIMGDVSIISVEKQNKKKPATPLTRSAQCRRPMMEAAAPAAATPCGENL